MSGQKQRWWRKLLNPKVLIPVLLTSALVAFLLSVADLPKVFGRISSIPLIDLAAVFGLALAYLALKGFELNMLLSQLDLDVGWRKLLLAYAIGEMTLTIPVGVYAQNYVLERLGSAGFARSSAATTAMLVFEGPVVLVATFVIGVPGWWWLRPTILGLLCFWALLAIIIFFARRSERLREGVSRLFDRKYLRRVGRGLQDLWQGLRALAYPPVLASAIGITVVYLALLSLGFLVVSHGVGLTHTTYEEAVGIYAFSLAVMLIFGGILSQLGVIEAAGVTAAQAWGYGFDEALAMLLGFRLVWVTSVWIIGGTTTFLLRKELARPSAGDEVEKSSD